MSDKTDTKTQAGAGAKSSGHSYAAESQAERWVKYGANTALVVVIAAVLALFAVAIAQMKRFRSDTTASGVNSLKPQTVKLIQDLPQKVKIVGLFTRASHEEQEKKSTGTDDNPAVRYDKVADLLQEYQAKSNGKIAVEMIDPITQPARVDALFNEVTKKYGNDVRKYDEVLKEYPKTFEKINQLAEKEVEELRKLVPAIGDNKTLGRAWQEALGTVAIFPQALGETGRYVKQQIELKVPDYKGAADAIRSGPPNMPSGLGLEGLKESVEAVVRRLKSVAEDAKTPEPFKKYAADSEPRYNEIKKAADDLLKKMEGLGQLKQLDELRQNKSNSIAVMAENDMKVLPYSAIFKTENVRSMDAEGKVRPRFAAEQQISTALVTLTAKEKKKIAIVRAGGPPLATAMPMMREGAPFSLVFDRLREYNVEVLEKDVTGMWAMQAMQMMRGMPPPPEPSDEDLKGAAWIVFVQPEDPRQAMMNPGGAGQLGTKVAEHLKNGGSAMLLVSPQVEKLDFLKDWGIEPKANYLIVHERIEAQGAKSEDRTAEYQRQQPFFVFDKYGDHPITRPIETLDSLLVPLVPVNTVEAKGVKTTRLLPVPASPKAWGESDIESVYNRKQVEYNAAKKDDKEADLAAPLWAGAAAENDKGQRVLVIGCPYFASNGLIEEPDMEVLQTQRRLVPRFPGNAELFVNSAFWVSKMDTMIAISPTALEVPRIAQMGDGAKVLWRVTAAGILPLGVIAAGAFVWLKRRD